MVMSSPHFTKAHTCVILTNVDVKEAGRRGGKIGGKIGGKARAAKMTAKQRSDAARLAVLARWAKARKGKPK
jgi:hypothetical protein